MPVVHVILFTEKEQNQMEEFSNRKLPPSYGEATKKIRVVKYGTMERQDSQNYSGQISEEYVQPVSEENYEKEQNYFQNDNKSSTNPFRQHYVN